MIETVEKAEKNKELGMKVAVDHADKVITGWHLSAFAILIEFLRKNDGKPFLGEDVRLYANLNGLPSCPDVSDRAWGAIMNKASKAKLIKSIGYAQTKNPNAHRTPATLWVKNESLFQ